MASKELRHIDISEIHSIPDFVHLAEEVKASKQPRVLTCNGQDLVEVRPPKPLRRSRGERGVLAADDPLFSIIGIGRSGLGDVSANTDKYLADA